MAEEAAAKTNLDASFVLMDAEDMTVPFARFHGDLSGSGPRR
jgi:hypothetical protein